MSDATSNPRGELGDPGPDLEARWRYVDDVGRWTLLLGSAGSLAASLWWDMSMALGLVVGAALAFLNFRLTASVLHTALTRISEVADQPGAPEEVVDEAPEQPEIPTDLGLEIEDDLDVGPSPDARPEEPELTPRQKRATSLQSTLVGVSWLLKLPALLVALGIVLWYLPARPEGIALGVGLTLLAAVLAALLPLPRAPDGHAVR